jgi:hypothetical protein
MTAADRVLADLAHGWSELPADTVPVVLTAHAIKRANDHVLRMLSLEAATKRLCLCLPDAVVRRTAPEWIKASRHTERHSEVVAWLVIESFQLAFPLYSRSSDGGIVAGTALTPPTNTTSVGATVHGDDLSALFDSGAGSEAGGRTGALGAGPRSGA